VVVSTRAQQGSEEVAEVAEETLRHVAWLRSAGVVEVPFPAIPTSPEVEPTPAPEVPVRVQPLVAPAPGSPEPAGLPQGGVQGTSAAGDARPGHAASSVAAAAPSSSSDKGCGSEALLAIRRGLGECTRCKLAAGRTHVVFGVGNPRAELLFVGEGPGADEDQQGEPFVGKAGQLLTKMIEAMGFRREDVYIANVVKCRPPGNRNPEPDEIAACEPFLRAQIAAISPKVIVALGKFAAQTLLRDPTPISKLRGRWSSYGGVKLMPTFHPAYLLRSPEEKKRAWEDLQLVMKELGRPVSRR
jgi:uracil-DNA glycosylase family 4